MCNTYKICVTHFYESLYQNVIFCRFGRMVSAITHSFKLTFVYMYNTLEYLPLIEFIPFFHYLFAFEIFLEKSIKYILSAFPGFCQVNKELVTKDI